MRSFGTKLNQNTITQADFDIERLKTKSLKTFIEESGKTVTGAAQELKVTRQHLSSVVNGGPVGKVLAKDIEEWSGGSVDKEQLLYPEKNGG